MLRTVNTFVGHAINDGSDYLAYLLNPFARPSAKPVYIEQVDADAQDSGAFTVDAYTLAITIQIKDYANRVALVAQLQRWCKPGVFGDLVMTYTDDGLDYYKPCRVVNLIQDPTNSLRFTLMLSTGWSAFRAVNPDSYTWNLTGTGGDHTVTLAGDDEAPLSVTFTNSVGPSSGYLWQKLYQLVNKAGVPALGWGPWCVTIDTAALITDNSNKCQINGSINNSVTTIPYDTITGSIPDAGMGIIGTEQIRWTGRTGTISGNLTGVTRGIGGTTAASHADNTEIKLSYMLANCNDLRIFIDGVQQRRWIVNPNNSSTQVWFNLSLITGQTLTLLTAIDSSSDIDFIEFARDTDSLNALTALPNAGYLVHGTEWIAYQGKDLYSYRLGVTTRGAQDTTKQSHAAGDSFGYVQHAINICFGNASAVDPASTDAHYNDTKPLFLLTSTNDSWVYSAASKFCDAAGTGRTGGFTPAILARLGAESRLWHTKRGDSTSGADPAMGMEIMTTLKGNGPLSEHGRLAFSLYRGCGIDTVTVTGEKQYGVTTWPATAALQYSGDGSTYINAWNELVPVASSANTGTWYALSAHTDVSVSNNPWIRFYFDGVMTRANQAYAIFEILTATIDFVSANLPTGTLLTRKANVQVDMVMSNAANGDEFEVIMPMLPNKSLVLDGETKVVQYDHANAHDVLTPNDASRDWWMRLQVGDNVLSIAAEDVGTLQAVLSWYRRRF